MLDCLSLTQPKRRLLLAALWPALISALLCGCRSGKQVKDREYCPVQSVAKTSWCPAPGDTTESQTMSTLGRPELIDANLEQRDRSQPALGSESAAARTTDRSASETQSSRRNVNRPVHDNQTDTQTDRKTQSEQQQDQDARNNPESSETSSGMDADSAVAVTVAVTGGIDDTASSGTFSIADLIGFALTQNPEVAIARKEIEIACAKIPQAASLADPMVDVIGWPIYPNVQQTAGGRMTAEIMLSQEVPWAGKRESRVGQAAREVNRLQSQKAAIELKIANEVKQAWYDYWLASQKVAIAQSDLAFLKDLLERAKVLYEGGSVGQQDLLRLQSEIGLNAANVAELEAERTQAQAELLRVLNWPPEQPLNWDASICDIEQAQIPDRANALAQATAASPELQAIWAEVQRDQWKVTESRLNYYPDLKFSAGWGGMTTRDALAPTADGVDNLIAGVSFNLPVRIAARDAALRESESEVVKGLRDWERFRNQTERDVIKLHAILVSLKAQLATYQADVVPQLKDALEVTQAAYEVNKSDLSDVINLRREILRLREAELELKARWCQARADLTMLMAEVDW